MSDTLKAIEEIGKQIDGFKSDAEKKQAEITADINEKMAAQGKTLGEIQTEVLEMKKQYGQQALVAKGEAEAKASFKDLFAKALEENFEQIKTVGGGQAAKFHMKTVGNMLLSANLTGSSVAQYSLTPALRGRRKAFFTDFIDVIPSATGTWKYYRQNTPVGEGSFGVQTEGSAKAQIDYDVTEKTVTADVIAGFARISNQMITDLPFMQGFLPGELAEDHARSRDNKYINSFMAEIAAYSTTASVYAEKIIEWIAAIMARDYNATNVLTTSANWATLLTTKPADYSIPGGVTITSTGDVAVAGVPVNVVNGLTGTATIVGDFSRVKIIQVDGLNVRFFEQDSDNVQKNLITVRAESRENIAVLRPDAFLYV